MTEPSPRPDWDPEEIRGILSGSGYQPPGELPPIGWFGDGPELARELGELVQKGTKTATAGLAWEWEAEGGPPPVGYREVVIDWEGRPLAVILLTEVQILPFEEVDADFARDEGEGDRSLDGWRKAHWSYFSRQCERLGRTPSTQMPVVCMRFRVLHSV